jgi:protein CpxP
MSVQARGFASLRQALKGESSALTKIFLKLSASQGVLQEVHCIMKFPLKSMLPGFALALLAAGPMARAQDAATPPPPPQAPANGGDDQAPPPPHHRMRPLSAEQLKAKLNLTDDQFAKVKAIVDSTRDQIMALRDDDSLSDDDRRDKMMAIGKASHDQIRVLLNPDQQKIFDSMKPPHRPGQGEPGSGQSQPGQGQGEEGQPPPPPPPSNS